MKRTKENLEHRIKLKLTEIENYEKVIVNYPPDRYERHAVPYLQMLNNHLTILRNELEDREDRREIKSKLGYSRIGRNNV